MVEKLRGGFHGWVRISGLQRCLGRWADSEKNAPHPPRPGPLDRADGSAGKFLWVGERPGQYFNR